MGNRQNGARGRGIDNHQGGFQRGAVRLACIGLAATTALTAPALAANRVWNGQLDDDWFTAQNWDGSALPDSPEVVVINNHSGTSMPFISGGDATAGTITVGTDGSTATLTINNGGTLTTGYWYDYIGGVEGTPAVAGSTGTVIVDGFGSMWTSGMGISIGHSGTGTLRIVNGGSVKAGPVITIGSLVGGVGTVVVDGFDSSLAAGTAQAQVGGQGTGSLTISNGASANIGSIQVGTGKINTATGAHGTLLIESGGYLLMTAANQENIIANEADTTGSATITGGSSAWNVAGTLHIGYQGNGSATVSDGATVLTSKETISPISTARAAPSPSMAPTPHGRPPVTSVWASASSKVPKAPPWAS